MRFDHGCVPAIVTSAAMIIAVFIWLGIESATGFLNTGDEFFTAERSREMLLRGPWAVRNNFEVIGIKPPLQYWLTAPVLARFQNRELAVRMWPLIYGALTALAVGWLMFVVDPNRPWLMAVAVALLLTCPIFLRETYRALLDSGLTFFTTLAIVFAQLARKRPGWWLGVGLACSLGTLQKIPLIILVWLIVIVARLSAPDERKTLRNGWLLLAIVATTLALATWPLFQLLQFRLSLADLFRSGEVMDIIARRASRVYLEIPFRLTTAWPCGAFALAAAIIVPFVIKNKGPRMVRELSCVCITLFVLGIVSNLRNVRYLLPIVPCLCVLLALFLSWMLEHRKTRNTIVILVVAVLSAAGIPVAQWIIRHDRLDLSDETRIARELGLRETSTKQSLLVEADKDVQREEFYLFYGNLKFPVTHLTLAQIGEHPRPPLVGICHVRNLAAIQKQFPALQIQSTIGQFVCWEVDG